ncbi:transcriptional regulatory [Fusarium longipes]|uniref:Transcriptional regulatory n=1 Tax=Fusarium longipes TaxID=694270 RepID=A0A395T6J6_9HYPO|nr:transcriptional regulatory [Fusarium longipes]
MATTNLARYACDYCRQKKFREIPKCRACKPWPGPCNYSRDIPNLSASSTTTAVVRNTEKPDDIQLRLQNIENAVQNLTDVVTKAMATVEEFSSIRWNKNINLHSPQITIDDHSSVLHVGKHNSFSVLEDARSSVHQATETLSSPLHQSAANELDYLSSSLTTAVADSQLRMHSFYIPSKALGYQLIGRFLEHIHLGDAFFTRPSEDIIVQTVFKPETVQRKAWIVFIDYMILAMLSKDQITEAQGFRHNVKLALNDSKIFLEPHLTHLQSLILLAIHGEDYASPSLSWMLVGHACRQAEALGLHLSDTSDFETNQRRLSLFWMLFAVDKSCSLAFGRPSFFSPVTYAKVALPDLRHLTRFQPPSDSSSNSEGGESTFGAHMFLERINLAKLMGDVLDLLNCDAVVSKKDQSKANLTEWHTTTNHLLNDIVKTEKSFSSPSQLREMSLGISTMNFEYLHVCMALTRDDKSCIDSRLDTAREAISLLPSMVSNWTSIYNPMTCPRHQLYFPFIPFFIIFENLVQGRASLPETTIEHDIELLSTTITYYSDMREQFQLLAPLCERLTHIATVFHRLVLDQVGYPGTLGQDEVRVQPFPPTEGQNIGSMDSNTTLSLQEMELQLGDEIGVDLKQYMQWLSSDVLSVEPEAQGHIPTENLADETGTSFQAGGQDNVPRGIKRPLDVMFDWFAWDSY